jgi:hypothetical protein
MVADHRDTGPCRASSLPVHHRVRRKVESEDTAKNHAWLNEAGISSHPAVAVDVVYTPGVLGGIRRDSG